MIKYKKIYDSSRTIPEKLFFAIHNLDIQGLEYIVAGAKTPDIDTLKNSSNLLIFAYDQELLEAAYLLVGFGLHYNPITLLYSHPSNSNVTLYRTHLTKLKVHLSESVYIETNKLLSAAVSYPIASYNMSACINYPAMIANYTHTDNENNSVKIYNFISSIFSLNNEIVKNSFIPIALSTLHPRNSKIAIYLTISQSSEKYASYVADFTNSNREIIYLPLDELSKYQAGIMVHEFKHTGNQILFSNKANPYSFLDTSLQAIYHEVVKNTIIAVFQLFDGYRYFKKVIEDLYQTNDVESLKYNDFIKAASYNPLIIFKYKTDWNNPKFINDVYSVFPFTVNKDTGFETQVSEVKKFYDFFVNKYHLNEPQLEMLDRIAECITRPIEDIDSEMIVRVGELYAKGLNKTTLQPLSLLEGYELQIIAPEISKLQNSLAIKECVDPIAVQLKVNVIGEIEVTHD